MEIERKYLITNLPENYKNFPCYEIEQAYLCIEPVVRVRKENDSCYLTCKGKGLLAREEFNLPLDRQSYEHLLKKADGIIITKKRYRLPLTDKPELTIELDIFSGYYEGLVLAEVEFPSAEMAMSFTPPAWFGEDVTFTGQYQNSNLSRPDQGG